MIIKIDDDTLADVQSISRWIVSKIPDSDGWAAGFVPEWSVEGVNRVATLHTGSQDDCRAFLKSLAVRLGAVRWNAGKRAFVPVAGGDDG